VPCKHTATASSQHSITSTPHFFITLLHQTPPRRRTWCFGAILLASHAGPPSSPLLSLQYLTLVLLATLQTDTSCPAAATFTQLSHSTPIYPTALFRPDIFTTVMLMTAPLLTPQASKWSASKRRPSRPSPELTAPSRTRRQQLVAVYAGPHSSHLSLPAAGRLLYPRNPNRTSGRIKNVNRIHQLDSRRGLRCDEGRQLVRRGHPLRPIHFRQWSQRSAIG
jgi:hypothetical protein